MIDLWKNRGRARLPLVVVLDATLAAYCRREAIGGGGRCRLLSVSYLPGGVPKTSAHRHSALPRDREYALCVRRPFAIHDVWHHFAEGHY